MGKQTASHKMFMINWTSFGMQSELKEMLFKYMIHTIKQCFLPLWLMEINHLHVWLINDLDQPGAWSSLDL